MMAETTEKKRKAIAFPDTSTKKTKKSKKSLEIQDSAPKPIKAPAPSVIEPAETTAKPKHKPRKRAADFLEDDATNGTAALVVEEAADKLAEKAKKKSKKENTTIATTSAAELSTAVKGLKKDKVKAKAGTDNPVAIPAVQPPVILPPKQQPTAIESNTEAVTAADLLDTPMQNGNTKRKRNKKAKAGQIPSSDAILTADGVNGVAEKDDDEALNPMTSKDMVASSLQAEGQFTAEKELEDEWGTEDEDEEQGAALLAGFDSDGEDTAVDKDLEEGKPVPGLSKKAKKELQKAVQERNSEGPGTVYVGRIPHGFYEHQMREYFSQFGTITKLRLSRNKRTGASKHFAFIEFESEEVAKIVAKTMDNYLMFGHILKCKYAPQESLHPTLWKGANKRYKKVPHTMLERKALEAPKTKEQWAKKTAKEQRKRERKAEEMKQIGYEMPLPKMKDAGDVLEQRKLQASEQPKILEAPNEVPAAPTGVIQPPKGLPKDEVALKAEEKKSKKGKKTKKQLIEAIAQPATAPQPAELVEEKVEPEGEKRDKRKAKKEKVNAAKVEQKQLDSQLSGAVETTGVDTKTANTTVSASTNLTSVPITNGSAEPAEILPAASGGDKRKRRKSKKSGATEAATSTAVLEAATKADAPPSKEKAEKRKSDGEVELKSILKKSKKA